MLGGLQLFRLTAIVKWLMVKCGFWISLEECGAAGNGTTDDSAAIQIAINDGRDIWAGNKAYAVGKSLVVPLARKGVTVRGNHQHTEFRAIAAIGILTFPADLAGTTKYSTIDGIKFTASGAGIGAATGIAGSAGLAYVMFSDISRCEFSGNLRYGITGNCIVSKFERCGFGTDLAPSGGKFFKAFKLYATDNFQTMCRFVQCEFNNANDDYVGELEWGYNFVFRDCTFEGNATTAGVIKRTDVSQLKFEGCWGERNGAVPLEKRYDGAHAPIDMRTVFDNIHYEGFGAGPGDCLLDSTNSASKLYKLVESWLQNVTYISNDAASFDVRTECIEITNNKAGGITPTWIEQNSSRGTQTNDDAPTGHKGEYMSASQSTLTNFPATTVYGDGVSLPLTKGDWEVTLVADGALNGATLTGTCIFGISATTGNSGAGLVAGDNYLLTPVPTATADTSACIANYRVKLAADATYYAKVRADYSAGNPQYRLRMSARRQR